MQIRAFSLFAAALLLALVASQVGADQDWKKFTSEQGRFSISVPAQPVKSETSQKSFVGTVTNHVFTSESGKDDSFTVDYSDIPHFALHFAGADTIYEHAKGALLKQTFGKATAYSDVSVGDAKGKRLVYDTPEAPGHAAMRGHAILLLVGTRLYVVDAVLEESEADTKAERFLSSFEITP
jgi:hypothetical protein